MFKFLFLIPLAVLSEEFPSKLKGIWEVIPIIASLGETADFTPIYIDDTIDEPGSTVDMLIFQENKNIEWILNIRGTSVTSKSNVILSSQWSLYKIAYFDEDPFPDLLICSQDQRTLRLFKNKVRENQEIVKKEQLNPEYAENAEKLDDWPHFDLITVEKSSSIIDFLVSDVNHDGIPDVVIAVKHKDGRFSIQELIFSNTGFLTYNLQELSFENSGIVQLLGIYDLDFTKYSILFLSGLGTLSYMVNHDPLYSSMDLISINCTEKFSFFISTDLNKDMKPDFLLGFNEQLLWVHEKNEVWISDVIFPQGVLQVVKADWVGKNPDDVFVLYRDKVTWATQVTAKASADGFVWETNGELVTFHQYPIDLGVDYIWDRLKVTNLQKNGMVDMLLFSSDQATIFWGRKKPANLKGIGWGPDFWIYIMIYVMVMSLGAGLLHSHFLPDKIQEQSILKEHVDSNPPEEFKIDPKKKPVNFPRKTTV